VKFIRTVAESSVERDMRLLEIGLLIVLGLVAYWNGLATVRFFRDESTWIWTSQRMEALVRGDFQSDVWNPVEPPVTGYIIGAARRLAGYHVGDLNGRWNKNLGYGQNAAAGNVPSAGLLWVARLPMSILGVLGVVMGAFLVAKGHSRGAAYVFAALFFWNANYSYIFRQAMNEAPLLFFTMAGGVSMYLGSIAFAQQRTRTAILAFTTFGVMAGLAAETKTNGLGLLAAGMLMVLLLVVMGPGIADRRQLALGIGVAAIALGATIFTFLVTNPYLYAAPVKNVEVTIESRAILLRDQEDRFPEAVITGRDRWTIVPRRILGQYATFSFPYHYYISIGLLVLGLVAAAGRIWSREKGWEAQMVLLSLALFCAIPALFTPLDWDRYFMYPVVFARIYISMGLCSLLLLVLWRLVHPTGMRVPAERNEAA